MENAAESSVGITFQPSTSTEVGGLSPKKFKLETPRFIKPFLRSGMNKRPGKNFFIAFMAFKLELFQWYLTTFMHTKKDYSGTYSQNDKTIGYSIFELKENLKTDEILKLLADKCIIVNSPVICEYIKDFNRILSYLKSKPNLTYIDYFELPERNSFNYEIFTDYAISRNIQNPFTLTFEYSEISKNEQSELFLNYNDHFENSKLFVAMADRHKHSSAATKVVLSYVTERIARTSNQEYLREETNNIVNKWINEFDNDTKFEYVCLAEVMRILYGHFTLNKICSLSMLYFVECKPKKRWLCLCGSYDAGKSTLANGFKDIFGGINIQINLLDDTRRAFQLGMAIGHRYVLFDDVRETGIKNLDNSMRDYLDGHHKVILERKNRDPVEQYFPPGMITSNISSFPESLTKRIKFINIIAQPSIYKAHMSYMNTRFDKVGVIVLLQILGLLNIEGIDLMSDFENSVNVYRKQFKKKHSNCQYCLKYNTEYFEGEGTTTKTNKDSGEISTSPETSNTQA